MADRITRAHLNALCARLNRIFGAPNEPWSTDSSGKHRGNIGNFHVSQQCGGFAIERMSNESGGVSQVGGYGHTSAREVYTRIHAYIEGLEHGLELAKTREAKAASNTLTFTRVPSDINGNPRYAIHFLNMLTEAESNDGSVSLDSKYETAVKRANRIGGRKYHNKRYGGGIVFQTYSIDAITNSINAVTGRHFEAAKD